MNLIYLSVVMTEEVSLCRLYSKAWAYSVLLAY